MQVPASPPRVGVDPSTNPPPGPGGEMALSPSAPGDENKDGAASLAPSAPRVSHAPPPSGGEGPGESGHGAASLAVPHPPAASAQPPAIPSTYGTVFTNHKAGMEAVDFDRVKRATYEASVGSAHFKNEQRKEADLAARLERLAVRAASFTAAEIATATASTSGRVAELIARRDRGRVWALVDLDCFFGAVEEKDDPSLIGTAFAVGSTSMISTASYTARAHGIRSAMPGFVALKLLPSLRFVVPRFERYVQEARAVREVLAVFDPRFHAAGLDEAYLDLTAYCERTGKDGLEAAHDVRAAIRAATGLAASAGVAPNRMLAKMGADYGKPDGAFVVPSADAPALTAWVSALPVRKVPGIGRVAERTLGALGVKSCGDLFAARGLVALLFSKASADFFLAASLGAGSDEAEGEEGEDDASAPGRRGMSAERTFLPTRNRGELEERLRSLAARLARGCAGEGLAPRTLTLKLKLASFEVRTRATTLRGAVVDAAVRAGREVAAESATACPSSDDDENDDPAAPTPPAVTALADALAAAGLRLLRAEPVCEVRLLGLRLSNWAEAAEVAALPPGQRALEGLVKKNEETAQVQAPPPPSKPPQPLASSSSWTCGICTYAGTPYPILRCEVCSSLRGAKPGDLITGAGVVGEPAQQGPAKKKGRVGQGGGVAAMFGRRRGG